MEIVTPHSITCQIEKGKILSKSYFDCDFSNKISFNLNSHNDFSLKGYCVGSFTGYFEICRPYNSYGKLKDIFRDKPGFMLLLLDGTFKYGIDIHGKSVGKSYNLTLNHAVLLPESGSSDIQILKSFLEERYHVVFHTFDTTCYYWYLKCRKRFKGFKVNFLEYLSNAYIYYSSHNLPFPTLVDYKSQYFIFLHKVKNMCYVVNFNYKTQTWEPNKQYSGEEVSYLPNQVSIDSVLNASDSDNSSDNPYFHELNRVLSCESQVPELLPVTYFGKQLTFSELAFLCDDNLSRVLENPQFCIQGKHYSRNTSLRRLQEILLPFTSNF